MRKPSQVPRSCWPACPSHRSREPSSQSWVPCCGQELGSAPCGTVWEQSMEPCAALLGPHSRSKRVFLFYCSSWGSSAMAEGFVCRNARPSRGGAAGEGSAAPRAVPATWQSPISIISRQHHSPCTAHGATRPAASRGSVLAGL